MKVRATRTGYFNHLRRRGDDMLGEDKGDVFTIPDQPRRKVRKTAQQEAEKVVDTATGVERSIVKRVFRADPPEILAVADKDGTVPAALGSWMLPVNSGTPEKTTTAQQAVTKASDDIKAGRQAERSTGSETTGNAEVI